MSRLRERCAFSVDSFCDAHEISRGLFYRLLREGDGPEIMKIGAATRISAEAAARWRAKMEAKAAGEAAA